ncbi:MAG TPA: glycosyltransferase family 2 protein [Gemmatales bacterium]|nr:glycosyltransferase family 2 protein [Gemmatales bacterium]HMP61105.1 glycosyltransferase family 2 protein [Gemmatales bacterium]
MDVSVIVPIKDERENLKPLHEAVRAALEPTGLAWELILVDDGSTDGSFDVLAELAAADRRVKVVELRRNYGQTPALRAGIDAARGAAIVTMDGDLQNDPADIPMLLDHLRDGCDVALGWRKDRQDHWLSRKLPSLLANALIRRVTRVPIRDLGCTLRAMKREAAQELSLYGEMHRFMSVLAQQSGHRFVQVPVRHHPRRFGQTKYNLTRTFRVLLDLITVKFLNSYLTRPMHVFGTGGLLCFVLAGLTLLTTITQRLVWDERMNRNPLLLLSVLLVVVGVQFISLGLIGEVLARTYFESQGKTSYLVRRRLNLDPPTPVPEARSRAA